MTQLIVMITAFAVTGCGTTLDTEIQRGSLDEPDVPPAHDVAPPSARRLIGSGSEFTCHIRPDATVACWGWNLFGQLGDGTTRQRFTPAKVRGVEDVVDLSVGLFSGCARSADGRVHCWGRFNGISNAPTPVLVPELAGSKQIVLGNGFFCGLTNEGRVSCHGSMLGAPADGRVLVDGVENIVELVGGQRHVCARRSDGAVLCWGHNDLGQLGDGTTEQREGVVTVDGVPPVTALWSDAATMFARTAQGAFWVWGYDRTRSTDENREQPRAPTRRDDPEARFAKARWVSSRCLVDATRQVWCRPRPEPLSSRLEAEYRLVDFGGPIEALSVGASHVCGLSTTGEIRCFGNNNRGQLGRGDAIDAISRPTDVSDLDDAVELVAGEWDVCARRTNGRVSCWQIRRHGLTKSAAGAQEIAGLREVAALHSGGQYTCAVDRSDVTQCWGLTTWRACVWRSPDNCQPEQWDQPTKVQGLAGIAGGLEVIGECVRLGSGQVHCVERYEGRNTGPISGIDDASQLAGAAWLRCARRASGRVTCRWPRIGNPDTMEFVDIDGISDAIDVSAAQSHVCIVHTDGRLSCSAFTTASDLCQSHDAPCARPTAVPGVSDAVQVVAGEGFSCLRHRDGGVSCFGSGEFGVLGDGRTDDHDRPQRVLDIDDATQLVARQHHVCALRRSGRVACWGRILPGRERDDTPTDPVVMR